MREDVVKRLAAFGYEICESDDWSLDFVILKTQNNIAHACGTSDIPDGLYENAVDIAAGEFLYQKKVAGQLGELTKFDPDTAVKEIREGDVSVVYALGESSLTPGQRLDKLIAFLCASGAERIAGFRRLKW